jgi:hypothetical protein
MALTLCHSGSECYGIQRPQSHAESQSPVPYLNAWFGWGGEKPRRKSTSETTTPAHADFRDTLLQALAFGESEGAMFLDRSPLTLAQWVYHSIGSFWKLPNRVR